VLVVTVPLDGNAIPPFIVVNPLNMFEPEKVLLADKDTLLEDPPIGINTYDKSVPSAVKYPVNPDIM
jgi:hypothetical protein